MHCKMKQLTMISAALITIFCGNAFAATPVEECKTRETIEENQRLADLNMGRESMPDDQFKQEYKDIVRESAAVKKQCERDPAFVKLIVNEQAKAD